MRVPTVSPKAMGGTRERGSKIVARRPATGAKEDMGMRKEVVSHMTWSWASSSSAM